MRVRMKHHLTGYRNGESWPPAGGTIDLPDHEANDLIAAGHATPAPDLEVVADAAEPEQDDDSTAAGADDDQATADTADATTGADDGTASTQPEADAQAVKPKRGR